MVERFSDRLRRALLGTGKTSNPEHPTAHPTSVTTTGPGKSPTANPPVDPRARGAGERPDAAPSSRRHHARDGVPPPAAMRPYPGDFVGVPAMHYAPEPDGLPDPGEIVWTWVPFEEKPSVGKDRPVLLVGLDGDWLLGVMLTSKDHDRELAHEHARGRDWIDVGSGSWDSRGRPSEVRTDRIIRVDPDAVRREGAVLDRERFDAVADAIRETA